MGYLKRCGESKYRIATALDLLSALTAPAALINLGSISSGAKTLSQMAGMNDASLLERLNIEGRKAVLTVRTHLRLQRWKLRPCAQLRRRHGVDNVPSKPCRAWGQPRGAFEEQQCSQRPIPDE
jgi:hypothetical protein